MRLYKKFIIFLAITSAACSMFLLMDTYAKYLTSAKQITNIPIARWNIKVNTASIKDGQILSSLVTPIFPGTEHIASGIIAPTAEGYFDLYLDSSDVDVSFSYNISILPNENSSVSDLVVTGYSIDGGETVTFNSTTGITDNILYGSGIHSRTIRVFIKWDDSELASMNNIEDANATLDSSNSVLLDVNITFTQIAS